MNGVVGVVWHDSGEAVVIKIINITCTCFWDCCIVVVLRCRESAVMARHGSSDTPRRDMNVVPFCSGSKSGVVLMINDYNRLRTRGGFAAVVL